MTRLAQLPIYIAHVAVSLDRSKLRCDSTKSLEKIVFYYILLVAESHYLKEINFICFYNCYFLLSA